jgi:hypothetical protein
MFLHGLVWDLVLVFKFAECGRFAFSFGIFVLRDSLLDVVLVLRPCLLLFAFNVECLGHGSLER